MAWLTRISWLLGGKNIEAKIVIVGLADSGKSTIMHQLKPREVDMATLIPNVPVDLQAQRFTSKAFTFIAFDLGNNQNGFGNPWEDFYRNCHGIIFVVDSTDRFAMPLVRRHLAAMLHNPLLRSQRNPVPLLILANKMDQPGAVPCLQLVQLLELGTSIRRHPWTVLPCDGLTGEGLNEAFDWLAHELRKVCKSKPVAGT